MARALSVLPYNRGTRQPSPKEILAQLPTDGPRDGTTGGRGQHPMTAAALLGVVIGALLGLLAGGGSILAVPALLYGVGMPLAAAVPPSLLVVGASSATAVLPRLRTGHVRWRIAAVFGLARAGTTFAGAAVNRLLDPSIVLIGLAALMVAAAVRMLRGQPKTGGCTSPAAGSVQRSGGRGR